MPHSLPSTQELDRLASVRSALLDLTYRCPLGQYKPACPFNQLSSLSHDSRRQVFERLDEPQLLDLFTLLPACACPADPRGKL